jgi:transcription-repair coupling factor (superfamily II helicase)
LPEAYVPLEAQRVGLYKRLAQVRTLRAVRDIEEEMRDRYGRPPDPAEALIEMAALRVVASLCAVQRVAGTPKGMRLEPTGEPRAFLRRMELARHHRPALREIRLDSKDVIEVVIKPPTSRPLSMLHEAVGLLEQLAGQEKQ